MFLTAAPLLLGSSLLTGKSTMLAGFLSDTYCLRSLVTGLGLMNRTARLDRASMCTRLTIYRFRLENVPVLTL